MIHMANVIYPEAFQLNLIHPCEGNMFRNLVYLLTVEVKI